MGHNTETLRKKISEKGLKVTPQRISILQAIFDLNNHPTAEQIIAYIHQDNPNIATGTVYNVLETLVEKNLVKKVKTENDIMRYEGFIGNHHHLYCTECDYIEDYENSELDALIDKFFKENDINNFIIEDIRLQINGKFIKHKIVKQNLEN
jgi:Fur family peroxide stress response transcriptional regulator